MVSSKVQEIKQSAQDVAEDISAKTQATASDIAAETKGVLEHAGDRVVQESTEVKTEIETLLGKVYDLLKPDASYDLRRQIRGSLDDMNHKVTAWAEGHEEEWSTALGNTRLRTRRAVSERPLASLLVAAGAGAALAYWLTHRPPGH